MAKKLPGKNANPLVAIDFETLGGRITKEVILDALDPWMPTITVTADELLKEFDIVSPDVRGPLPILPPILPKPARKAAAKGGKGRNELNAPEASKTESTAQADTNTEATRTKKNVQQQVRAVTEVLKAGLRPRGSDGRVVRRGTANS